MGCYRYKRLPFGLKIAPEAFQKINEQNFGDIPNITIYIDDIAIATENEIEHDKTVELLMKRAKEKNVKFNKEKIQYKQKEIMFLGHLISKQGIALNPNRMQAIQALKPPKNKKELQIMLGFINYVRNYIPNLSDISTPLRELLKKSVVFQWLDRHDQCLLKIKNMIANAPTLKAFNCNEQITIQTDASKDGLGCCLMQNKRPVSFASCSLTDSEKNYAQIEKEMLAIVFASSK